MPPASGRPPRVGARRAARARSAAERQASTSRPAARPRAMAPIGGDRSRPERREAGVDARRRALRRSRRWRGRSAAGCAAASMPILVSQAVCGHPVHARVGAQVGEQAVAGGVAVVEDQARRSPKAPASGSSAGARRSAGRRRPRPVSAAVLPRARIRSGTHGLSVGIVRWTACRRRPPGRAPRPRRRRRRAARKIGLRSA